MKKWIIAASSLIATSAVSNPTIHREPPWEVSLPQAGVLEVFSDERFSEEQHRPMCSTHHTFDVAASEADIVILQSRTISGKDTWYFAKFYRNGFFVDYGWVQAKEVSSGLMQADNPLQLSSSHNGPIPSPSESQQSQQKQHQLMHSGGCEADRSLVGKTMYILDNVPIYSPDWNPYGDGEVPLVLYGNSNQSDAEGPGDKVHVISIDYRGFAKVSRWNYVWKKWNYFWIYSGALTSDPSKIPPDFRFKWDKEK
jgi:hypothetical protein